MVLIGESGDQILVFFFLFFGFFFFFFDLNNSIFPANLKKPNQIKKILTSICFDTPFILAMALDQKPIGIDVCKI